MLDLSIIIVNYNVRHFVLRCIESIYGSADALTKEIIVIDNASIDGSVEAIKAKFPDVIVIANTQNIGFGKANNQGIKQALGTATLILNPDTILATDTLALCHKSLFNDEGRAAIGVKMIDGKGTYLPESKRGLPDFWASFYKMSGLYRLMPTSSVFNAYYAGHIPENEEADVEVLTGAFMYMRTAVLQKLGGFDEAFFMYGEDIDLSKRLLDAGYTIRYLPSTKIIHFKGESTKKTSLNYIRSFYSAMSIYSAKHHTQSNQKALKLLTAIIVPLLGLGVYFKNLVVSKSRLIVETALIFASFLLSKELWSRLFFNDANYFEKSVIVNTALYTFVIMVSLWFWGWYDKYSKGKHLLFSYLLALIVILMIYALLPLGYRSSRVLIFMGMGISSLLLIAFRSFSSYLSRNQERPKILIVAKQENASHLFDTIKSIVKEAELVGIISPDDNDASPEHYLNTIKNLNEVITTFKPDEVIFSAKDMTNSVIMDHMSYPTAHIRYKIASSDNAMIIGSDDKNKRGNVYEVAAAYNLARPVYRRLKTISDVMIGLGLLLAYPYYGIVKQKYTLISALKMIGLWQSAFGYTNNTIANTINLPPIKPSVWSVDQLIGQVISGTIILDNEMAERSYAKHYNPWMDMLLLKERLSSRE